MEELAGQLQECTRWEFLEVINKIFSFKNMHHTIEIAFAFTMCQNVDSLIMHVKETVQASLNILQWTITFEKIY